MDFPWLTTVGALPLAGAVVVTLAPKARARHLALAFSLLTLALALVVALKFDVHGGARYQFTEKVHWIPEFGVSYAVGVDGIALVMILLAVVLVPICVLAGWNEVEADRAR